MLNTEKIRFDTNELELISSALNFFITNEIEDIPLMEKLDNNILAVATLKKLSSHTGGFLRNHYSIMGAALLHLHHTIYKTRVIPTEISDSTDVDKYLAFISDILSKIEKVSNVLDSTIFPEQ